MPVPVKVNSVSLVGRSHGIFKKDGRYEAWGKKRFFIFLRPLENILLIFWVFLKNSSEIHIQVSPENICWQNHIQVSPEKKKNKNLLYFFCKEFKPSSPILEVIWASSPFFFKKLHKIWCVISSILVSRSPIWSYKPSCIKWQMRSFAQRHGIRHYCICRFWYNLICTHIMCPICLYNTFLS